MFDIHCHILPGLDDGSPSMEISLAMAEMAIADGITHVVGTPHANSAFKFVPEFIRERREELQAQLGSQLTILTGCDFHLSYENLEAIRAKPSVYTLNQKDCLLIEFANFSIPPSMDQVLHQLQLLGLRLIITHPERNPLIRGQRERLWGWMRQGCYVQVTAQSFTGHFGENAQHMAETLLDANAIHFIASDAHDLTARPLRLKETYELVAKRKGEALARALLEENPRAAAEGRPLPYLPEPPELPMAKIRPASGTKRKRFWFF